MKPDTWMSLVVEVRQGTKVKRINMTSRLEITHDATRMFQLETKVHDLQAQLANAQMELSDEIRGIASQIFHVSK